MEGALMSDFRDAIEYLPPGAMLVVPGVPWEKYERLLDEQSDRPGARVTYDRGRLPAVASLCGREIYKVVVSSLATLTPDEFNWPWKAQSSECPKSGDMMEGQCLQVSSSTGPG
jgi:hypothetical protein